MKAKCQRCGRFSPDAKFLSTTCNLIENFDLRMIPFCSDECRSVVENHYWQSIYQGKTEGFIKYYKIEKYQIYEKDRFIRTDGN